MAKPAIITLDSGINNADLPKTTQRLIKGNSWRKTPVIMLIPAGDTIPAKVYLSHCGLLFPPNQSVHRMLAQGMEVGEAFSTSIEMILEHPELSQFKYILTIEHDMIPPQDGLIKLIERMENHSEFAWISGLYFCKGENGCSQVWGDIHDSIINFRPQIPTGDLQECYGTGMGFALWRLSMFKDKRLKRPFFKTHTGKDGEGVGTQDLTFAVDARKYGYRCAVDGAIRVGHYDMEGRFGQPDMTW